MALIVTLLGLCLFMVIAPETPAGRLLRRGLVDGPGRWLAQISRGNMIVSVAIVIFAALSVCFLDEELVFVMSLMAPEALAYIAMFEIGTLVDAILTVTIAATTVRFQRFTGFVRAIRLPARAARDRRPSRPVASNDDEDSDAPWVIRAAA